MRAFFCPIMKERERERDEKQKKNRKNEHEKRKSRNSRGLLIFQSSKSTRARLEWFSSLPIFTGRRKDELPNYIISYIWANYLTFDTNPKLRQSKRIYKYFRSSLSSAKVFIFHWLWEKNFHKYVDNGKLWIQGGCAKQKRWIAYTHELFKKGRRMIWEKLMRVRDLETRLANRGRARGKIGNKISSTRTIQDNPRSSPKGLTSNLATGERKTLRDFHADRTRWVFSSCFWII